MTTDAAPTVMTLVRADRALRPPRDAQRAIDLRAVLQAWPLSAPRTVRPSDLRTPAPVGASLALFRGIVVARVLAMIVAGYEPADPFAEAMASLGIDQPTGELVDRWRGLSPEHRAQLRAECIAHVDVLRRTLGEVSPTWLPRCGVATAVRVGAHLMLRDYVDLVLGDVNADASCVALVDVTTAPLSAHTDQIARYHALTHTLRTGTMPWCVVFLSTATGAIRRLDVDTALDLAVVELRAALFQQDVAA
jgi:hypothetical protein